MTTTILWALHVRATDAIIAMPDYETAVAFADWFTAVDRGNMPEEQAPIFAAVPCLWPSDAERHADDIVNRVSCPPCLRDYPADVPRGSIAQLTEIARHHPLCKLGQAARATTSAERQS